MCECVCVIFNTTNTSSTVENIKSLSNCPLYIVRKFYCNFIWYKSMTILCSSIHSRMFRHFAADNISF